MCELRRHCHRKSAVVNIKKQDKSCAAGQDAGRSLAPRTPAWTMIFVVAAAATTALGQTAKPVPDSGPLEDTWRYLIDLFRMLVGL
jgi:hypothetical protein